jgi:ketosteroid isomerase-like protein
MRVMSQENVEIVRKVFDAAARRDSAAVFDLYDPYVVWDASRTERGAITGKVVQGREGLLKWLREWYEPWETLDDTLEELIDAGQQRVVTVVVQRGRGRASGVEVENRLGGVWTVQDGKIIRVVWFPSREDALEAVRLLEQDAL